MEPGYRIVDARSRVLQKCKIVLPELESSNPQPLKHLTNLSFPYGIDAARLKSRRGITLPWLVRITKTQLATTEEAGWSSVNKTGRQKGQKVQASRSWVYEWMIKQGYISRKKGNKRPTFPEDTHPYLSFLCFSELTK